MSLRPRTRSLRVATHGQQGATLVQYSKLFLEVREGIGIVTLGVTLLVVLVAIAALILHFAS